MKTRTIAGREVTPIGLGCMGLSHAYGTAIDKTEAVSILRQAYDMGYTLYDTAECYTGVNADGTTSYNEELVGEAIQPFRDKVFLATKCGVTHTGHGLLTDSRPETIRKSVAGSLKRLGTDYIDLYYQHRIDPDVTPEEVAGAMADLIKEGKILSWGISETDEAYLRRAHAVCPVAAIQNRYSMLARWYERTMFPVVEELGIAYVAFSPIANGFLSGKFDQNSQFEQGDFRSFMPQYTAEGMERGKALLDLLKTLAAEKNATPAQLSLAWMLGKKEYIIPIPGSRKVERLRENLASADVELTLAEIADIDMRLDGMNFLVFGGHSATK